MRPPLPTDWGMRLDSDGLRAWRKVRRINQRDLATILGVSHITIARWELGDNPVPPYLHLALESIERRLVFSQPAPRLPSTRTPRPKQSSRKPATTSIGLGYSPAP
jgi:transcriptional regulator with XRE-family HTH domain